MASYCHLSCLCEDIWDSRILIEQVRVHIGKHCTAQSTLYFTVYFVHCTSQRIVYTILHRVWSTLYFIVHSVNCILLQFTHLRKLVNVCQIVIIISHWYGLRQ